MKRKVAITVGGTGGHLYPAEALAEKLLREGHEVFFLGGGLKTNPYFTSRNIPFQEVASDPLNGRGIFRKLKGIGKIAIGFCESLAAIHRFQPDVIVGFGSYHTFPSLLSAKFFSCPIILHEANAVPGKVNRFFAPYVDQFAVHFPTTVTKTNVKVVGMPIRSHLHPEVVSREEALAYFGLKGDEKVVLIFGGSQGALGLNTLVYSALVDFVREPVFVLHFTGEGKGREGIAAGYKERNIPAIVKAFESRIDYAWKVATLAVTRAGASSVAERVRFGVPGVLIPYPQATDHHQDKNADALVGKTGGVLKLIEKEITSERLGKAIEDILGNEKQYSAMRSALIRYRDEEFQDGLYELVVKTVGGEA